MIILLLTAGVYGQTAADNGDNALDRALREYGEAVRNYREAIGLDDFVRINGGTFTMGSPANEAGRWDYEVQHQVTVSSFYMGKYEVTQMEWTAVMGSNPSYFKGDNLPVEQVSWYDALVFCNKLRILKGLTPLTA